MTKWPEWWRWDLEFSPHVLRRMLDRGFSETDVRVMMEGASGLREAAEPGRWIVATAHESRAWEIVVEPDAHDQLIVVITAFPVDS